LKIKELEAQNKALKSETMLMRSKLELNAVHCEQMKKETEEKVSNAEKKMQQLSAESERKVKEEGEKVKSSIIYIYIYIYILFAICIFWPSLNCLVYSYSSLPQSKL